MRRVDVDVLIVAEEGVVVKVPPSWFILMVEMRLTGHVGTNMTLVRVRRVPFSSMTVTKP